MLIYGSIFQKESMQFSGAPNDYQKESMQFSGAPNDEYDGMPALKELMHA